MGNQKLANENDGSGVESSRQMQNQLTESPDPTPSKIDLRDAHAIRREMASVYRDARSGQIQSQDATRFVYILDMIRKAFETSSLQDRLEFLEHLIEKRK